MIKLTPLQCEGPRQKFYFCARQPHYLAAKARRDRHRRAARPPSLHGFHFLLFLFWDQSPHGLFLLRDHYCSVVSVVLGSTNKHHRVPRYRCWLAAYPAAYRFSFSLLPSCFSVWLAESCCRRVVRHELHIAVERMEING